jgi:hypothetical protein
MDAVFELVHGYFSSYRDSLLSQSVGQDCPHNAPLLMRCKNFLWTRKETAVQQGCHTAVEKTGVGDPHLV